MGNNCQILTLGQFDGATITASSHDLDVAKNKVIDYNYYTYWSSTGSDDSTAEYLEFVLSSAVKISRVWLLGGNIKSGSVQYDPDGVSGYSTFGSAFDDTNEDKLVSHGSEISVTKLKVNMLTTITANQDKRIGLILPVKLFFEFTYNPDSWDDLTKQANIETNNLRGLINYSSRFEAVKRIGIGFNHLLSGTDLTNIKALERSRASFLLNMCGDTEKDLEGWNWKDIRRYVITNNVKMKLANGSIASGLKQALVLEESKK